MVRILEWRLTIIRRLHFVRQVVAPNFPIVSEVNAPIRKSWMRPNEQSAANLVGWLNKLTATDFFISLWV